ncbi:TetR/AcrR family transcriptional regulator [Streptomyces sp. NPDC057580]|uniref:TetR/AcrR family transcriptional regulator n=1 Tax=Streptomyces sp. NPDC057580 TaxID=3346173 RepID=UPI0036B40110
MHMTQTPQAKPRKPRGSLNQQVITQAALRIADRDGIDALTFPALGRELGAHPTAIYRHFRDKDELILALTDELHARAQASGLPATDDWAEDLRVFARRIHHVFMTHPQVGQLVAARTARRPHEFETVEHIIDCLRRGGLPDPEIGRCYRVFTDFVLSYSSMEAALFALDETARQADLRAWEVDYRRLPSERFPNLAMLADHIPPLDSPTNFEFALELMISAIRSRNHPADEPGRSPSSTGPTVE